MKPTICFAGYGRSGKDTGAEWFRDHTNLSFQGGCSWTGREYMARRLSEDEGRLITPDEAYARRHEDRMKWYNYLNEYREGDPSRLVRDCLAHSDIVCGVRDREELLGSRCLLDLIIWVDRDVEIDPTVTYTIDDCDVIVRNRFDKQDYYRHLERLAKSFGLEVH